MIKKCIRKEHLDCIQFTKENRDEFLKIMEPNLDDEHIFIKEETDRYCLIEHLGWCKAYYYYNHWYVLGADGDYLWNQYSPEDFQEMFKLVE